jgi:hypothetical protein
MDRSQVLKKIDKAWRALLASYAGLSEAEMQAPGVVSDWSVKDIIAHVTTWNEEALKHLPTILAGQRPQKYSVAYGGIDAFNAMMLVQLREVPLSEVLERRDHIYRRLISYIQQVPEELLATETRFRRRLRFDTYRHYAEHTRTITDWRQRVTSHGDG